MRAHGKDVECFHARGTSFRPTGGKGHAGRGQRLPQESVKNTPVSSAPAAKGGERAGKGKGNRALPEGNCACPAAQRVWRGYDWVRGVQERSLFCDRRSAAEQQSIMDRNAGASDACVFLSLLAFHRYGENLEFFDQRWGPVAQERLGAVFGQYTRFYKVGLRVYGLTSAGAVSLDMTVGGRVGEHIRSVLLVPTSDGLHCLPLGVLRPDAVVQLPPLVAADIVPMSRDVVVAEAAPQPAAAEVARPAAGVIAQPCASSQEVLGCELGDGADTLMATIASAVGNLIAPHSEWEDLGLDLSLIPSEIDLYFGALEPDCSVAYRGIQAPPRTFRAKAMEWRGGWFPTQCPSGASLIMPLLKNMIMDVAFASATLDNFELFGTTPFYLGVRFEGGLQLAGRRTVTDGKQSVEFFTAGDAIHVGSSVWTVQQEPGGWLRVVATNLSAGVRGRQPLARFRRGAKVQAALETVAKSSRAKALWQLACLTNDDPVETAILSRMRADEAQQDYKGADAESSADLVRVLASRYRTAGNVSGPYGWGGCYSCGTPLVGKMRQRICKSCTKRNTGLGKLVAEGCKVTSLSVPRRYPGVVWTRSRHPPLKSGVETVATEACFHMPHLGSRHCRPPPSVTAHVSAGWA